MKYELPEEIYSGYIFDCDGTLADSMPLHYQAWTQSIERFGSTAEFSERVFYSWGGIATADIVRRLNEQFGDSMPVEELVDYKKGAYLDLLSGVKPIDEVANYARRIAAAGRPVAVVSGGLLSAVTQTLDFIGLGDVFEIVITPVDVERGKPAPDMFLLAAERMGVPASGCVVFEDGPSGIEGAKAAGMATVYIDSRPDGIKA